MSPSIGYPSPYSLNGLITALPTYSLNSIPFRPSTAPRPRLRLSSSLVVSPFNTYIPPSTYQSQNISTSPSAPPPTIKHRLPPSLSQPLLSGYSCTPSSYHSSSRYGHRLQHLTPHHRPQYTQDRPAPLFLGCRNTIVEDMDSVDNDKKMLMGWMNFGLGRLLYNLRKS